MESHFTVFIQDGGNLLAMAIPESTNNRGYSLARVSTHASDLLPDFRTRLSMIS
jgi:hypothetical protein